MGYIPPIHYSAYHHYLANKNGFVQTPFTFTRVQRAKLLKEDQKRNFKKIVTNYQKMQIEVLIEIDDHSTQKIYSQMTGVGRFINLLI